MNRIYFILFLVAISCSRADMYKNKLVPGGKGTAMNSPYGVFIEATCKDDIINGEYIAFQNDTLYVLGLDEMQIVLLNDIHYVNLILTRTRAKGYAIATGVAITPALIGAMANPDYSGEFLSVGAITAATGLLATLIESQRKAHVEHYNGSAQDLKKSAKYARFPKGIPPSVNPMDLKTVD
jgi:hypothetical protein